jgi:hypothetical protein
MSKADPSKTLLNARHEVFASRSARGMTNGDAWKATIPFGAQYKGGDNALRVTGFKVAQRPEVIARVAFLREQEKKATQHASEALSHADVIRLNLEVSEALETAYMAADAACVPPQKLEALKRVLAAHLSRQGKLEQPDSFDNGSSENSAAYETLLLNMSKTCTCPMT